MDTYLQTQTENNLQSKSQNEALANAFSGVSHTGLSHAQSIQCLGTYGLCIRLVLRREGNFQCLLCT